jgi:hypothetical protein
MTSVTTNAPGDLELFHSRVMNLCVIGDGFIASLETTGGPREIPHSPYECCDSKPEMNNFVKQSV